MEEARHSLDLLHAEEGNGKQKQKKVENASHIVVCLYTGTNVDEDNAAMAIASKIADSSPTEVHLVCLLLVPRHLPLQSPLNQQEDSASSAVERAEQFFSARKVVHHASVERARDVASGLIDVLKEIDASLIILPLIHDRLKSEDNLKLVESVTRQVERNVVFVRG